jgi:hypothetical protein
MGCSPHSLGPYQEISWIRIRLPETPKSSIRFESGRVAFVQQSGSEQPTITGGFIAFDAEKREVELSLMTAAGPYWANGRYPWRAGFAM